MIPAPAAQASRMAPAPAVMRLKTDDRAVMTAASLLI